jgi:hypothetical protein
LEAERLEQEKIEGAKKLTTRCEKTMKRINAKNQKEYEQLIKELEKETEQEKAREQLEKKRRISSTERMVKEKINLYKAHRISQNEKTHINSSTKTVSEAQTIHFRMQQAFEKKQARKIKALEDKKLMYKKKRMKDDLEEHQKNYEQKLEELGQERETRLKQKWKHEEEYKQQIKEFESYYLNQVIEQEQTKKEKQLNTEDPREVKRSYDIKIKNQIKLTTDPKLKKEIELRVHKMKNPVVPFKYRGITSSVPLATADDDQSQQSWNYEKSSTHGASPIHHPPRSVNRIVSDNSRVSPKPHVNSKNLGNKFKKRREISMNRTEKNTLSYKEIEKIPYVIAGPPGMKEIQPSAPFSSYTGGGRQSRSFTSKNEEKKYIKIPLEKKPDYLKELREKGIIRDLDPNHKLKFKYKKVLEDENLTKNEKRVIIGEKAKVAMEELEKKEQKLWSKGDKNVYVKKLEEITDGILTIAKAKLEMLDELQS